MKILLLNPANPHVPNVIRDFIYGCWCRGKRIGGMQLPPLQLLFVASVLQEAGHAVRLVDAPVDPEGYDAAMARPGGFDVAVLQTSSNSFGDDMASMERLRQANPAMRVIVYGSHPTFNPEQVLGRCDVDAIVRKEAEFAVRDLVAAYGAGGDGWRAVPGVGYRDGERIVVNPDYRKVGMDELAIPDRTLLPGADRYFLPVVRRTPFTTVQTSRGCPAKCNFCASPFFYGNKVRHRHVDGVMQELRTLRDQGYREVLFRDETFTVFTKRNAEICRRLIDERLDLTWICNTRADTIDRANMELFKAAGCHMMKVGIESGDQRILDNLQKGTTVEQGRQVFAWGREVGIDMHAHVMLGSPGETEETIEKTIRFVESLQPHSISYGLFTPFQGTTIFDRVAQDDPHLVDGSDMRMEQLHTHSFYSEHFTTVSPRYLEKSLLRAYRRFYLHPRGLRRILGSIRSWDHLMRVVLGGMKVVEFSAFGE